MEKLFTPTSHNLLLSEMWTEFDEDNSSSSPFDPKISKPVSVVRLPGTAVGGFDTEIKTRKLIVTSDRNEPNNLWARMVYYTIH